MTVIMGILLGTAETGEYEVESTVDAVYSAAEKLVLLAPATLPEIDDEAVEIVSVRVSCISDVEVMWTVYVVLMCLTVERLAYCRLSTTVMAAPVTIVSPPSSAVVLPFHPRVPYGTSELVDEELVVTVAVTSSVT